MHLKNIYIASLCLVIIALVIPHTAQLASNYKTPNYNTSNLIATFQTGSLTIVGPNNDPSPVVNETGQISLTILDRNQQPITTGIKFESDSPEIATIDATTGLLTGKQQGYATITAQTPMGTVSNFVAVTKVNKGKGKLVPGDAKVGLDGSVYISDPNNHIILKRDSSSASVTTFAGQMGVRGKADGQRTLAQFAGPLGVAVDNRSQGGIYVADTLNNIIRKVDFNNNVITVLGSSSQGTMGDITPFDQAVFKNPQSVAVTSGGNLVIADTGNHALYLADFSKKEVRLLAGSPSIAGNTDGKGRSALFNRPVSISISAGKTSFFASATNEVVLVADAGNNLIRAVTLDGQVTTVGKSMKPLADTEISPKVDDPFVFSNPQSISLDSLGNIYVVDDSGVKVITSQDSLSKRQAVSLAQANSFGKAASVVVQGSNTFVLDTLATTEDEAIKVVTIGAPKIDSLSINRASIDGGDEIVISGRNFAPETQVVLGDQLIKAPTINSARQLRIRLPQQQSGGDRTLTIQTRGGMDQRRFTIVPKSLSSLSDGQITTVVGGIPYLGDGGLATAKETALSASTIAMDVQGNLFIADDLNNRIRRVDANTAVITTVAGNGRADFSGDGALAVGASLNAPESVAIDSKGNLFICDTNNHCIRKVDVNTGIITTFAGKGGMAGFGGDKGQATSAMLDSPSAITLDKAGNLFIADFNNSRIRKVDLNSIITTVVGTDTTGFNGDGKLATETTLSFPNGIFIDESGNLLIADSANDRIRRVDAVTGVVSTVAGTGQEDFNGDQIAATSANLNFPTSVVLDSSGNLFITDSFHNRVRRVDAISKMITTVAGNGRADFSGDGILATNSGLRPIDVIVDGAGNLFIAGDQDNNRVFKVDTQSQKILTIAGTGKAEFDGDSFLATSAVIQPIAITFDNNGNLLLVDRFTNRVRRVDANTGIITSLAGCTQDIGDCPDNGSMATNINLSPTDIAVDKAGNILITESDNNIVRKLDSNQNLTIIAGTGDAGDEGDGGQATKAMLSSPNGIAIDKAGNILIADSDNGRIRKIDSNGVITTVVADVGSFPISITLDGSNNFFISDAFDNVVKRVDANTKAISTVAGKGCDPLADPNCLAGDGGQAKSAGLNTPTDIIIDGNSNLFIAEAFSSRVRQVNASNGLINPVVGNGTAGFSGDGAAALQASLNFVRSLAVDKAGNLFIADLNNGRIRAVKNAVKPSSQPRQVSITSAIFKKTTLNITGAGFTVFGCSVMVNGKDISSLITSQTDTQISLQGNKKAFNLRKGANQITVISNGVTSNTFVLNKFALSEK